MVRYWSAKSVKVVRIHPQPQKHFNILIYKIKNVFMITVKDLKKFISDNKLDSKSIVITLNEDDNTFGIVKHLSLLNIEGAYDWITEDGDKLVGKHGDYVSTIEHCNGKLSNEVTNVIKDHYRMTYGTNGISAASISDFEIELKRFDNLDDSKLISWGKFHLIDDIKILPTSVSLHYSDPYGHSVNINPKYPILALIKGVKVIQKIKESDSSNLILKFNKFMKVNESSNSPVKIWNEYVKLVDIIDGILSEHGELSSRYWIDSAYDELEDITNADVTIEYITSNLSRIRQNFKDLWDGLEGWSISGHSVERYGNMYEIDKSLFEL
jgi:hypothetical protein